MKCVQVVGQGVPIRLSDDDAFQLVERDKDGQYCPKRVWKKHWGASEYGISQGGLSAGYRRITPTGRLERI